VEETLEQFFDALFSECDHLRPLILEYERTQKYID